MYTGLAYTYVAAFNHRKFQDAFYTDALKYRENGRKKELKYTVTPQEDGIYGIYEHSRNDSILGALTGRSGKVDSAPTLWEAAGKANELLVAHMYERKGRIERAFAPSIYEGYNWKHISEALKQEANAAPHQEAPKP